MFVFFSSRLGIVGSIAVSVVVTRRLREAWLKTAATEHGSWWPDMLAWLGDRCGKDKPAPEELGGGGLRPLAAAPGTYVFDT